jgi:uncharacterized membrane protein
MRDKKIVSNQSSRPILTIRIAIPILGLLGMAISSYLTYVHYKEVSPICLPIAPCDAVLSSPYTVVWVIPLSLLGLLMYILLAFLGFWFLREKTHGQTLIALVVYTLALSGTLFTGYLYYLEIFIIRAFCTWCIASSLVIFLILALSLINLRSTERYVKEVPHFMRRRISRYIQW